MLSRTAFAELPGWAEHDHAAALETFRRSAREILAQGSGFARALRFGGSRAAWEEACRTGLGATDARSFFQTSFRAYRVADADRPQGLFTGYYEPEIEGSREAGPDYPVPFYRRPADLVAFSPEERARTGLAYGRRIAGEPCPYLTRSEIEQGALSGQGLETAWAKDWADAFFIHIQGSGRLKLPDGSSLRLTYDGKSGLPYTAIGAILVQRGQVKAEEMSMQAIRRWMAANPEQARALMWENRSFVFFREAVLENPGLGALGAQHVQLTPRRSLAVDREIWAFGTPVWLDTAVPSSDEGGMNRFRQLLIAQDTGSAIKGLARGDVYWGFGAAAGEIAGAMKSAGAMTVLLPHAVADELGLAP